MRVKVLFFGMLKDLAGKDSDTLELSDGARVEDLLQFWRGSIARFSEYEKSLALAVNQQYAPASTVLRDGDEVAVLPPVSGGSAGETPTKTCGRVRIVHEPIDLELETESLKHRDVGAVTVFEGIVRDHSRGRRTVYLDYEAFEPMALKQLEILAAEAKQKFQIRDVAIVHRLGRLEIGETSVLIAVASAHRGAAFEACRWIIDTLKKTVPIWKKEYFEDGAVWADGEPFPEEVRAWKPNVADGSAKLD
jgi:MoaE-MoaD fusion protein